MKKIKKILIFVVIGFLFFMNVSAKTVTCDYKDYKLVYNTEKYEELTDQTIPYKYLNVYDKFGNKLEYTFYLEGEPDRSVDIILSITYLFRIQPESSDKCSNVLVFQKPGGEVQKLNINKNNDKSDSNANKNNDKSDSNANNNNDNSSRKVNCGNITDIPKKIPKLTSFFVTMVEIAVPVILVIMGMMDLFKGVTAQKEDEIKKGQQTFIKRIIVAILVFFVIVIVKLLVSVVAEGTNSKNIVNCIDCFLSNKCS